MTGKVGVELAALGDGHGAERAGGHDVLDDAPEAAVDEWMKVGCVKLRKSWYLTALIVGLMLVLNADQNLLSPVLTPVAREFGFLEFDANGDPIMVYDEKLKTNVTKVNATMRDQKLGGDITLAFFMLGGLVSVVVGYLTDTVNRRNTLAVVTVIGETACLATWWVTGYWGLWATRAMTGVAIGGAVPLVFSLFGDLFTIRNRGKAVAAAGMAIGAGTGIGQTLSGIVAGEDGSNWRVSFVIVSVPAYFLVALLLATVSEPARGQKEEALIGLEEELEDFVPYDEKITWSQFKELLKTPTAVLVFLQGIPGSLPWGIFATYFSDFLAEEKSIDRALTGIVLLIFGAGVTVGAIVAGFMADRLFEKRKRLIPLILAGMTALGALPMALYVEIDTSSLLVTALVVIPGGFCLGFAGNTTKVILVNVTVPEVRGSAFSILNLFDDLGKGLLVFVLSKFFTLFDEKPEKTARAAGIQAGFLIGWILCGFTIGLMFFTIDKDYARAQATVAKNVAESRRKSQRLDKVTTEDI